jgi:drug/metabolite transporter (DMT)-like permease
MSAPEALPTSLNEQADSAAPAPASSLPPAVWRGVLYIALAVLVFAAMDTVGKYLMTRYNVPLVAAVRYIVNLALLAAIFAPTKGYGLVTTHRTGLVVVRALSLAVASLFAGLALQRMPVGETIAIIYLQPFGVMIAASLFLGERVGRAGWLATALGFLGVLLIARPGSGLDPWGVLFAVSAAAVSVTYHILSRLLATTETTEAMLFVTAIAGTLVFGVMLPWSLYGPPPEVLDYLLLAAMGVLATLGHFLFTSAYRHAPASVLAPVNYLHLLWAGLLGVIVFGHVPGAPAIAGMGLIALAGVVAAVRSRLPA